MTFASNVFGTFSGKLLPSPNKIDVYKELTAGKLADNSIGLAFVIAVAVILALFTIPARKLDKIDAERVGPIINNEIKPVFDPLKRRACPE